MPSMMRIGASYLQFRYLNYFHDEDSCIISAWQGLNTLANTIAKLCRRRRLHRQGQAAPRRVLEVPVSDSGLASAYVMHDADAKTADRVALVNLRAWDAASETDSVKVRRLRANAGVWATGFDEGGVSGAECDVGWRAVDVQGA
ncbi:hypothetical protein F4818DRAFT_406242 [Hypoxylon cercidicola]|nr:hypothetical protein F4818DRAFT_406242 [Hypoxylon cercidicola]